MEINIKGHSGCQLRIDPAGGRLKIIKSTSDPGYTHRLRQQCQKQKKYRAIGWSPIKIPEVLGESGGEGAYSFSMEYCNSSDFLSFIERSDFTTIQDQITHIINFVDTCIEKSARTSVNASVVHDKYADTKTKICGKYPGLFGVALAGFEARLRSLGPELSLPVGMCHGDLTFSNILTQDKNLILIDFLDSFIETPLQDIVKIRQDTFHHWSLNLLEKDCDRTKVKIVLNKIDQLIVEKYGNAYFYQYYPIFQTLNLLRIIPYTDDINLVNFLKNQLLRPLHD